MAKEVSPKANKSEILEAYNELLQKVQNQVAEPKKEKEKTDQKEILKKATSVDVEGIVKGIGELKLSLSASLDKIEDALINELKKLTTLQDAIAIETKTIEDLYKINVNADSLTALLLAQKEKKENFEQEISSDREAFDTEMKEKNAIWQKEQKEFEIKKKEELELLKKQRIREEEEYNYNIQLTRKKEQDAYHEKMALLEKELVENKSNFEKEFGEREANITAKEAEFAELKKQAITFPSQLEKTITETEKSVSAKLQLQFKHEKEILVKDYESEKKLNEQIISSLEQKINEQTILVKQLTDKADESIKQVKEIAVKAIEGSSNIRVFRDKKEENISL